MIYSMNSKGKNIRPLTWQGSYNSTPSYSPDGKQVVFSGRAGGRFDIFIMNSDGSGLRRLTSVKKLNNTWANNESPSFFSRWPVYCFYQIIKLEIINSIL